MPIATRTFRVFVSSTFEDLQEERDALQRDVFPKLRTLCERHGARFQAIDLRWGVRDEAALDQRTIEICFREIERCQKTGIKPNFILLLGKRYGWKPLPSRIEAGEFEAVQEHLGAEHRELLDSWYRCDENAVPSEYRLRARTGQWVDSDAWQAMEARLHRVLLDAACVTELSQGELIKYCASATHQEILKGLGKTPEDCRHVFAFCRNISDRDCDPDLVTLKRFLSTTLPEGNIFTFEPQAFPALCERVERTLSTVIDAVVPTFESRSSLELEIETHDGFALERGAVFGREDVLAQIEAFLQMSRNGPIVLHGPSGSGKSAIMAQASQRARTAFTLAVVVRRFIGVSPESSTGLTLLRSICEEIGEAYSTRTELPVDFNGVVRIFRERLACATSMRPMVIFLDALDQLDKDDPARSLTWLIETLPPNCWIVVSTTDAALALDQEGKVEIRGLSESDGAKALEHWLHEAHRRLQPEQRNKLLLAFSRCGLPFYLKLAFEEARGWTSWQALDECPLGEGIEAVVETLLNRLSHDANHGSVLVNRSLGYLAAARYGLTEEEIIDVLSADEEVWVDFERRAHHNPAERRLPMIVWSRLFLDLEPYLAERPAPGGIVACFYHRQLQERVATRFLNGGQDLLRHLSLARYFAGNPYWFDDGYRKPNARKVSEMNYHQRAAKRIDESVASLTDIQFLAAKCSANLVLDLQADYPAAISFLTEAHEDLRLNQESNERTALYIRDLIAYARGEIHKLEIPESTEPWNDQRIRAECERIATCPTQLDQLRLFSQFVAAESHSLINFARYTGFIVQQAFNSGPAGPVHAAAELEVNKLETPLLLRHWLPKEQYVLWPALLRTLEGHKGLVSNVSITPDGHRALTCATDMSVRAWDLQTGACLRTIEGQVRVLEGEIRPVEAVAITPDGRYGISASYDLRVWDLDGGKCLSTLEGDSTHFNGVAVTPDLSLAVTAGSDFTVRVWDLRAGKCIRIAKDHTNAVYGVSVTPDGRFAATGGLDGTVRVWDLARLRCLRTLSGHQDCVYGVSMTPDGRRAVSASHDRTLRVWDLETGVCLRVMNGHTQGLTSVSLTPDGRLAVSGSLDETVRLWDVDTGTCLRTLKGQADCVRSVSITANGGRAVSAGNDGMALLWDLERGDSARSLDGHTDRVNGLSVTPDGQWAVSWSSMENTLRMWNLGSAACIHTLEREDAGLITESVCLVITENGPRAVWRLAGSDRGSPLGVWDLVTGSRLRTLEGHTDWVVTVVGSVDGWPTVSASYDGTLRVWDLETGRCLRVLEHQRKRRSPPYDDIQRVTCLSMTPDGRLSVSGGYDGSLKVWDVENGRLVHTLAANNGLLRTVSVTPDGRLAACADLTSVRLWDLDNGKCLKVLNFRYSGPNTVTITPDGRRIVCCWTAQEGGWGDSGVQLIDAEEETWGECLLALTAQAGQNGIAVAPDSSWMASAGDDGTLRVWDLETIECLAIVRASAPIRSVAFSAPMYRLLAGLETGEVVMFDAQRLKSACSNRGGERGSTALVIDIDYRRARRRWEASPWWKRITWKRPQPATGRGRETE